MRVVVPYDAVRPKTRLSPALDADERAAFARAMLVDVLGAVRAAGGDPELLATGDVDADAPVTVDERALTPAVNDVLAAATGPVAVVMADLALATPAALERLFSADGEVVIAPGRGGGTNALVVGHPEFRVDYHDVSVRDHRRSASEVGADLAEVDSYRLSTDVDEPEDLPEVLLHGRERSRSWLADAGFEVAVEDGRVGIRRE